MRRVIFVVLLVVLLAVAIYAGWSVGTATGRPGLGVALSMGLYVLVVVGAVALVFAPTMWRTARLLKEGDAAEATIVEVVNTGFGFFSKSEVRLVLDVRPAEGAPFQAQARALVTGEQMSQLDAGEVVQVRIDPNDGKKVALDVEGS